MTEDRKKDAREKITLGGLVVKAGLRQADRAFLLGVLLEAATVRVGSPEHHRLKAKGGMAFQRDRLDAAKAAKAGPVVDDQYENSTGD
ncbi:conjugal transfer protein TraD [Brucella tritici]|uniref:Conjugal transfer protein TraD n=1 Tax=Brucella tritici TaxID=94626 RepID=A0A6L3YMP3_9HYPH|nr:conjugal transfer protein TraD [Brucella tritici]KAB2684356.1 conjugal transfer protein TraD [Brucella tritici]